MNLHAVAVGVISALNPQLQATIQVSLGSTTQDDGTRAPTYGPAQKIMVQVQALTGKDLNHLGYLNVSGSSHTLYLTGALEGIVREKKKGGDLIVLEDGRTFLVTQVLEQWPAWSKVAATLQMDS